MLIRNNQTECDLPVINSSRLTKPDQIRVAQTFYVELPDGLIVTVRRGFVSDFHSVPPWLWSLLPAFNNRTNVAAVVHDYLYIHWERFAYSNKPGTQDSRLYADYAYMSLMRQMSPRTRLRNQLYYIGVRAGGWYNWRIFRNKHKV